MKRIKTELKFSTIRRSSLGFFHKVTLFWSMPKKNMPWGQEILSLCGMAPLSLKNSLRKEHIPWLILKETSCRSPEMGSI